MIEEKKEWDEADNIVAKILSGENRYYQEVTIRTQEGACPFGHKDGEKYKVTALNNDGLCGSLYKAIHASITTLHYGGSLLWEKDKDAFTGSCPEMGRVQVHVKRYEQARPVIVKTRPPMKDMTGKGFPEIDRYRVFVEVLDIERKCYWGHRRGQKMEVDPFNTGGICGLLYAQLYPFIQTLLSGATPAWAGAEHSITAVCPDPYDQLSFRLFLEER